MVDHGAEGNGAGAGADVRGGGGGRGAGRVVDDASSLLLRGSCVVAKG